VRRLEDIRSASHKLLVNDTQRLKLFNYIVNCHYFFYLFLTAQKKHTYLTKNRNHGNERVPKFKQKIILRKMKNYVCQNNDGMN